MSGASERVTVAWRILERQWEQTRSEWRDDMGLEFERRFWRQFAEQTRNLRSTAERLDEMLARALRSHD